MSKKRNKRKAVYIASISLIAILSLTLQRVVNSSHHQSKFYSQQLEQKTAELQTLQKTVQAVHEQKADTEAQLEQKVATEAELKAQIDKLNAELQAKLASKSVVAVSGGCSTWLADAGVQDIQSATTLISRESGCNPNAINKSSGACGVAQELPCGKSGCNLGDGACQVAWMASYVSSRYGTWAVALSHSLTMNWY